MTKITLLDGGMGRELRARGVLGDGRLWSAQALIDAPDVVRSVHLDFIRAGAEVIITNNYTVLPRLIPDASERDRLITLSGTLARQAVEQSGTGARVAGSLPPLQNSYRPDLVQSVEEIVPLYRHIAALLAPYSDVLICETMSTASEALGAVQGALTGGSDRPVWVSWTLNDDRSGRLASGETVTEAFRMLEGLAVAAFLFNCCAPEAIAAALPELRVLTDRPIGAYANVFKPLPEGWLSSYRETREDLDTEAYAAHVARWLDGGASIVGGCCGIGPAHIVRLQQLIEIRTAG
jgi:S-methylmethionine-dependent homocysteine/selenocysteine methylase